MDSHPHPSHRGRRLPSLALIGTASLAMTLLATATPLASAGDDHHAPPTSPTKPPKPAPASPPPSHGGAAKKAPPTKPAASGDAAGRAAPHRDATHGAPNDGAAAKPSEKPTGGHPADVAAEPSHGATAAADEIPHEPPVATHHAHAKPGVSADDAMRRLIEGNARFVHDIDNQTARVIKRRGELASGQAPFAIVLSCADSRVPPELVFDQELGDLFVLRVAGNAADDAILGSIEYAVDHLGTQLILVMGHTACGAVKAAVETAASGKEADALPGHLPAVVAPIMPAVAETSGEPGDRVRLAVVRHVQRTVASLRSTGPSISRAVERGGLRVVGAIYDLASGEVDFLPDMSAMPTREPIEAATATDSTAGDTGHR